MYRLQQWFDGEPQPRVTIQEIQREIRTDIPCCHFATLDQRVEGGWLRLETWERTDSDIPSE